MLDLTFGEQVKLILSRRGMTIKELAETIEIRTGKKMSRQNLTQRLGRDNFQEQDMRMIAEILDCPFQLSILGEDGVTTEKIQNRPAEPVYEKEPEAAAEEPEETQERDITIGELVDIHEELDARIQEQEEKKNRQKEEKKHRTQRRGRLGSLSNHYSLFEFQVDCAAELGFEHIGVVRSEGRRRGAHFEEKEICFGKGVEKAFLMQLLGPRPRIQPIPSTENISHGEYSEISIDR